MADSEVTPEITARLRVGVSGHRTLTAALPGLTGEISKAVEYITAKLAVSAEVPLTVVSSLAEGADRTAVAGALSGYAAQRDYTRHAERSQLFAGFLDRALDRLLAARNLDGIQQATLAISRSMRDEATDWYSAVHTQELELPA
jgi:hypothetical protein